MSAGLTAGGLALGGVLLAACGATTTQGGTAASAAATCGHSAPRLVVHGMGLASGTPNLLTVQLQISVTRPSAAAALQADNLRTAAVLAALAGGGVAHSDIQTTGLTIQPNYVYPASGVPRLTGYQVDNSITAKLRDLGRAGTTVDSAARAGGNAGQIEGLTYTVADARSLDTAARVDAVRQAMARARAMARAAGDRLGAICTLTDTSPAPTPPVFGPIPGPLRATAAAPSPVPLEAGTQQVAATVTLVIGLRAG